MSSYRLRIFSNPETFVASYSVQHGSNKLTNNIKFDVCKLHSWTASESYTTVQVSAQELNGISVGRLVDIGCSNSHIQFVL